MSTTPITFEDKLIISFTSAVIFALLSSPRLFSISGNKTKKYGWETSSVDGCPYASGILLHSFLFFLIVLVIMIDNLLIAGIVASILALLVYLA
jgi:hypothetical protein